MVLRKAQRKSSRLAILRKSCERSRERRRSRNSCRSTIRRRSLSMASSNSNRMELEDRIWSSWFGRMPMPMPMPMPTTTKQLVRALALVRRPMAMWIAMLTRRPMATATTNPRSLQKRCRSQRGPRQRRRKKRNYRRSRVRKRRGRKRKRRRTICPMAGKTRGVKARTRIKRHRTSCAVSSRIKTPRKRVEPRTSVKVAKSLCRRLPTRVHPSRLLTARARLTKMRNTPTQTPCAIQQFFKTFR